MRRIKRTVAFRKSYDAVAGAIGMVKLDQLLTPMLFCLASDIPLERKFGDHLLTGNWATYKECHLRPDLLLIYQKVDTDILILAALGSHSKLFKK